MKADVNLFGPRVVVAVDSEFDCDLVVEEKSRQGRESGERLEGEVLKPHDFLGRMK